MQVKKFFSFFISFILGLEISSLWAAKKIIPSYILSHYSIIFPHDLLLWYQKWPFFFQEDFLNSFICIVLIFIFPISVRVLFQFQKKKIYSKYKYSDLHGSARFANKEDLINANLLNSPYTQIKNFILRKFSPDLEIEENANSVIIGGWKNPSGKFYYLKHSGPEHILTYAPTRSGKGVGLVIPTLLTWKNSCLITDIKGELWQLTSGWRKKYGKNKVLKFEPTDPYESAKWNPLAEVRINTHYEISDIQNIVSIIVDPDGKGLNDHWQKTSFSLLSGVILYCLYEKENTSTLSDVDEILSSENLDNFWKIMNSYKKKEKLNSDLINRAGRDMMNRAPEEASSVLSSVKSYLSLYRDPVISKNLSGMDFYIRDLMNYKEPVSLYLIIEPKDLSRLKPLFRIFITMVIQLLTVKSNFKDGNIIKSYKHRLLLMLDEFPSLGKLDVFQKSLGYLSGYGIKCYLICQDLNQLKSQEIGYGKDESIISNCHIQNAYPPNRIETANHLSRLTGETTILKKQKTFNHNGIGLYSGKKISYHFQEIKRPLLTPDECLRMKGPIKDKNGLIKKSGNMLIYVAGYPAILGNQVLYFQNKEFLESTKCPPPEKNDSLHEKRRIVFE